MTFSDEEILESLDQDDSFKRIPKGEYIVELEQRVKEYLAVSQVFPVNTTLYKHIQIPDFKTPEHKKEFWYEQFKRCRHGYQGMSGKEYFYFNFCYIENLQQGKIRPQYRVVDNEWFKLIEECQKSREWGLVCVKRRRAGASWKEAADVLHDCLFTSHFHVGMNSKTENDSKLLFRKVKFLYNNLPREMRVGYTSSTQMYIDFSYIDPVTNTKRGLQSDILVTAPTNSAFEGHMLSKWVCDEAGKIPNLLQLWSYTEDCLMQETRRVGTPVIFGTSGDIGKEGAGLRELWVNSDLYKLKRFFFAGWMGLSVDQYGNDAREEAIRWIVYERKRREKLSPKMYNDFIQKYPLTPEEALSDFTSSGLGDIVKINAQKTQLSLNPPSAARGSFRIVDNNVTWVPDSRGPVVIYEHPDSSTKYVAGCDPADIDDVTGEPSMLSTFIVSLPTGLHPPRIVMEYTDRPRELNNYYYQTLLALRYYNMAPVLIERQKGGRMISFFQDNQHFDLLVLEPHCGKRLNRPKNYRIGVHLGPYEKSYMSGLIVEYIDNYYELIPSIALLDELLVFGTKNTDRVIAFGLALMTVKERFRPNKKIDVEQKPWVPKFNYVRDAKGNIKLVR